MRIIFIILILGSLIFSWSNPVAIPVEAAKVEATSLAINAIQKIARNPKIYKFVKKIFNKIKNKLDKIFKSKHYRILENSYNAISAVKGTIDLIKGDNKESENIETNRNTILKNKEYIDRIVNEQKILQEKVNNNSYRINQLYAYTFALSDSVTQLKSQIDYIQKELKNINSNVKQNSIEITKIKNSIFSTGLDMWKLYLKTDDKTYLGNAIDDFTKSTKIDNNPYSYFYLTLCYSKIYILNQKEDEKKLAIENFKKFVNLSDNTQYILTGYLILSSIDDALQKKLKNIVKEKIVKVVKSFIKNGNYDKAVDIAGAYFLFSEDKAIYEYAVKQRKENYEKYKNFENKEEVYNILNKYHNALLNKEAVRYLYENNYYDDALNILRSKKIEDEDFRLKAYLAIFKKLGYEKKFNELTQLILTNPTYSTDLKKFVKRNII